MRQLLFTIIILTSLSLTGQQQKSYELDTFASIINWKGSYAFKFAEHVGTVHFQKGTLHTKDGNIIGGTFVIGMNSITNEDHILKRGPVGHLMNSDFFDVEKYPEAIMQINKVTYFENTNEHRFEGVLTIKGITKPVMFKALADKTTKTVKAKFKIDRREWGIVYNNNFKNDAISDAIEFDAILQF